MTCIDNQNFDIVDQRRNILQRSWLGISAYFKTFVAARVARAKQRRNRAAFMNLVGQESWLYDDIGIRESDVYWASRLPIEVNAARELEKIRLSNRKNL